MRSCREALPHVQSKLMAMFSLPRYLQARARPKVEVSSMSMQTGTS